MKDANQISVKAFTYIFNDSIKNNRRFCFILGSGASREAGIPTGLEMARKWSELINEKYEKKELSGLMKRLGIGSIEPTSKNYFGIYDLFFYPDYRDGHAYFEQELEKGSPSLGHHALAKILAGGTHNLAITTNFDSLIEDALFIYTDKRPLVVGHESLTEFINLNISRPIIAKIHRSLYFRPFNRQADTGELAVGWQDTLKNAFKVYTPIVIGYAGGDHSLMDFLNDDSVTMDGLYWCYWDKEEPSSEIVDLVKRKNGCFIPIEGFDQMMFMLSRKLDFENPEEEIYRVADKRIKRYNEQYADFESKIRNKTSSSDLLDATVQELDIYNEALLKAVNEKLKLENTPESYRMRGNLYYQRKEYKKAIKDYAKAIELRPNYWEVYSGRAAALNYLGEYQKAIEDCSKVIDLNNQYEVVYNNRGFAFNGLSEYEKAIADFTKAIELNPKYKNAYYNRGYTFDTIGEYEKAIAEFTKAIELNPKYEEAYNSRGFAYCNQKKYEKAIKDFEKAIELNPSFSNPRKHMGTIFYEKKDYQKSLEYLNQAIELNGKYKEAFDIRAKVYRALGELDKAMKDEKTAKILEG